MTIVMRLWISRIKAQMKRKKKKIGNILLKKIKEK